MKTIWKYTIPIYDYSEIVVKRNAIPLHVYQEQASISGDYFINVWMLVDEDETDAAYSFFVIGTRHPVLGGANYIGTVHVGRFVWHVFYSRK